MAYKDIDISNEQWHDGPYITATGTIRVTRSTDNSKNVTVNGTLTMQMSGHYYRPPSNAYQPPNYTSYVVLEYSGLTSWIKANGTNKQHRTYAGYSNIQASKKIGNQQLSVDASFTHTFNNAEVEWTTGDLEIYSGCIWETNGHCDKGWDATCIGKLSIDKLPYNEYKDPTISISASSNISKHDANRTVSIGANTSGDSTATTVYVTVNGNESSTSIGNSSGTYTFKPSDKGVGQASSYIVKARRVHSKKSNSQAVSNELTLYTYKLPTITDFNFVNDEISGRSTSSINYSCNNRKWTSYENQFQTFISYDSGSNWTEISNKPTNDDASNTAQTISIDETWINQRLDVTARSRDSNTIKVKLRRRNPSSEVNADTETKTLTVYFKPTKTIDTNNILYYKCKSDNSNPDTSKPLIPGNTYYIDEYPYVYIQWTYPSDIDGGVIDGYILKIYTDSSYNTVVTTKTINTTNLTVGQALNIRTELKRGSINYVGIQPFYNKPDGSGKLYGTEVKKQFIKPLGKLKAPIIDGPINGTTWHNNQFRILVTSSEDDDFDVEGVTEVNYRYKAIELNINGTTYTFANNSNIFSTSTIFYKKKIVINPSLVGSIFPDVNTYTIKIRFQKNYYENVWSPWTEITLNKSNINEITQAQGIKKDEKILLSHYTTVRNYSVRLYDVYFVNRNNLPSTNKELPSQSIIKAENYQGIYDSILQIQNKVNGYANFDNNRQNVKFNKNIDNFAGNNKPVRGEIITKDKISNNPIGRNYMNICIECMNKLSN